MLCWTLKLGLLLPQPAWALWVEGLVFSSGTLPKTYSWNLDVEWIIVMLTVLHKMFLAYMCDADLHIHAFCPSFLLYFLVVLILWLSSSFTKNLSFPFNYWSFHTCLPYFVCISNSVVLNSGCTLASPGKVWKISGCRLYPRTGKSIRSEATKALIFLKLLRSLQWNLQFSSNSIH